MKINAIRINGADNVATCVTKIMKGEMAAYLLDEAAESLTAAEDIPAWHKIALTDLSAGDHIVKYGKVIGKADRAIAKGGWVSHENISGIPRDYESELIDLPEQG